MHVHPIVAYLRMICSNLNFGLDNVPRPTGSQNLKGDFEGVPYHKVIGQNAMFRWCCLPTKEIGGCLLVVGR